MGLFSRKKTPAPTPPPLPDPELGKQSAQQPIRYGPEINYDFASYTPLSGNPCNFPGWGGGYAGIYRTYRQMLDHPTIAHVMSIIVDPIIGSTGDVDVSNKAPAGAGDLIADMLMPQRRRMMEDCSSWGTPFGWVGFEKVWEIRDGQYWLGEIAMQVHDTASIITERNGDYAGLAVPLIEPSTVGDNKISGLLANKSWVYTYRKYASNWYGRSRLENLRRYAWLRWLDCCQRIELLGQKLSGMIINATVPPGTFKDASGREISHRDSMLKQIQVIMNARNATQGIVNTAITVDSKDASIQLAALGKSLTKVETLDFGSHSPALAGLLQELIHYESLMFAGMLRSPRTASESQHGSRADSEQHTETGDQDSFMLATGIDEQFNTSVVDEILELNYGPAAKGTVKLKTLPFTDPKAIAANKLLDSMMQADGDLAARVADMANMDQLVADAGYTVRKTWDDTKDAAPPATIVNPNVPAAPPEPGKKAAA